MSKKVWIIAALVAMVTVPPLPKADAHYIVISGRLLYHSVTCDELLKNVQNLAKNPALVTCQGLGTVVETECAVRSGTSSEDRRPIPSPSSATAPVTQTLAEKNKGRGHATILLTEEDDLGITHEDSGCNNNWTLHRAILREAIVTYNTYDCTVDGFAGCQETISTLRACEHRGVHVHPARQRQLR